MQAPVGARLGHSESVSPPLSETVCRGEPTTENRIVPAGRPRVVLQVAFRADAMPTYEYRCTACGHEFEAFQQMTDDPFEQCPECGDRVKRLIGTGAGIIFKGSGFYETDYRSSEYREAAKREKQSGKGETTSDSGSSADKKEKPAGGADVSSASQTKSKKANDASSAA